jgi:heat-inducible transcriptional repressor
MPELSFRARKILYAVITEYIATGEPVGSRRLSRRYGLNLSPASIRNVLSDLEEAGLLSQPHTSAGRVPTDAGFRVFVEALVQMREISSEDRAAVTTRMRSLSPGEDVPREVGRLLATLTGTASVVATPRASEESLKQLRFMPLDDRRILAVLVTRSGKVQNRIVTLDESIEPSEIERVHNYLAGIVDGRSLSEVRSALANEMATDRNDYVALSSKMVAAVGGGLDQPEVHIEGQRLLFGRPEFASGEKIRAFLRAFEERERLLSLLDRTIVAGGVQVVIGLEANIEDVEDVSLVSATYKEPSGGMGTVGIIGPTRMDYAKVVPLVEFTATAMGRVLGGDTDDDADDDDLD